MAPACNLKGGKAEVQTAERSLLATQARWHGGRFWPVAPLEFTCVTFVCITTRRANVSHDRVAKGFRVDSNVYVTATAVTPSDALEHKTVGTAARESQSALKTAAVVPAVSG